MTDIELIHRYFTGQSSETEVDRLEKMLRVNMQLQDEFLLQAEIEAALRLEAQTLSDSPKKALIAEGYTSRHPNIWKWLSGVTTIAATLLAIFAFSLPSQQNAFAYPSLGKLNSNVSWKGKDIWGVARQGDLPGLRREIQNGADVNAKFDSEYTPLHMAAVFGKHEVVSLLLEEGASVSLADDEGNTALHMAAFFGNTKVVRTLLARGADAAKRNLDGFNPRDLVVLSWNDELEKYYLEMETLLDTHLDLVNIRAQRLTIQNVLTAAIDDENSRALPNMDIWKASIMGDLDAVSQHIAAGSNLNTKESVEGNTPLMLAAIFGNRDCAKLLIDAGVNLEARNNSRGTALHLACFFCQQDIVEMLLDKDVDRDKRDIRGMTARDIASVPWNPELKAIYGHVYDTLNLEVDFDRIRNVRSSILEILDDRK